MTLHNKTPRLPLLALLCLCLTSLASAQQPGVNPRNASDATTAQLFGKVCSVVWTTWKADFSRHTPEKGTQETSKVSNYANNGELLSVLSLDETGQTASQTIYEYEDGYKLGSTTTDAHGEVSLRTTFAYDEMGELASMRLADASDVTISTAGVSIEKKMTSVVEIFNDGETVTTSHIYGNDMRLEFVNWTSGDNSSELSLQYGSGKLPSKGQIRTSDGKLRQLSFDYEVDQQGNWTKRTTFVDGKPTEIAERSIKYY